MSLQVQTQFEQSICSPRSDAASLARAAVGGRYYSDRGQGKTCIQCQQMNLCGGRLVCEKLAVWFAKAVTAALLLCSSFFPFVASVPSSRDLCI